MVKSFITTLISAALKIEILQNARLNVKIYSVGITVNITGGLKFAVL